jgi:hypothetical protein
VARVGLAEPARALLREAVADPDTVDRFWAKVIQVPGLACAYWSAAIAGKGHGRFCVGAEGGRDVVVISHRFAWPLAYGVDDLDEVPLLGEGCDNPLCQGVGEGHVRPSTSALNRAGLSCWWWTAAVTRRVTASILGRSRSGSGRGGDRGPFRSPSGHQLLMGADCSRSRRTKGSWDIEFPRPDADRHPATCSGWLEEGAWSRARVYPICRPESARRIPRPAVARLQRHARVATMTRDRRDQVASRHALASYGDFPVRFMDDLRDPAVRGQAPTDRQSVALLLNGVEEQRAAALDLIQPHVRTPECVHVTNSHHVSPRVVDFVECRPSATGAQHHGIGLSARRALASPGTGTTPSDRNGSPGQAGISSQRRRASALDRCGRGLRARHHWPQPCAIPHSRRPSSFWRCERGARDTLRLSGPGYADARRPGQAPRARH